jgi:hypothetical protein
MTRAAASEPRQRVAREAAFQAICDRFIDRVVLPPFWTTGINHENEASDNARARARGRGVKPGVFDIYVCQYPARSVWLECKWGPNKPSDAQRAVYAALSLCGIARAFCWSINDVLAALAVAGFRLHGNAENLAAEYQARAEAAVREAEVKASRPRKVGKPRAIKPTPAQVRRAEAVRRVGLV